MQIERERRAREREAEESHADWQREHALSNRLMTRSFLTDWFAQPNLATQALATECAEALLLETGNHGDGSCAPATRGEPPAKSK